MQANSVPRRSASIRLYLPLLRSYIFLVAGRCSSASAPGPRGIRGMKASGRLKSFSSGIKSGALRDTVLTHRRCRLEPSPPTPTPPRREWTSAKIIVSFVARRLHMRRHAPRALPSRPPASFSPRPITGLML